MEEERLLMTVEIPRGGSNKYEFNVINQQWELDRVLPGAMVYPVEYGYFQETLGDDGDPADVICLTEKPTFPGCHLPVRIIGVLKMVDNGEEDHKILAVNAVDPRLSHINDLIDVNQNRLAEISNFFSRYKELEKKEVIVQGWKEKKEAYAVLAKYRNLYRKSVKI